MRVRSQVVVTVLIVLSVFLSACGPSTPPTSIKFMISGDPAEVKAYQTLVDAYQKGHANQKVEVVNVPSSGDYATRLAADLAAGTPADVIMLNYRQYASYAAKKALEPVGPYLGKSKVIKEGDFYPQAMAAFTFNGVPTCIPQNISSPVIYYNRDLFDAAGIAYPKDDWSWADFVTAAKTLTRAGAEGKPQQYGLGIQPEMVRLAPFV
jgi:multiple sugar transport system substrate-binding protein